MVLRHRHLEAQVQLLRACAWTSCGSPPLSSGWGSYNDARDLGVGEGQN